MADLQPLRSTMTDDQLLLTPEEAARVLRIGRTTLYALIKGGQLRPVHIGRSCRVSWAELERYVRGLEVPRAAPPRALARGRSATDQRELLPYSPTSPDAA